MTYPGVYYYQKLRLRLILVVFFVILIFTAVGLVGYISFKNAQIINGKAYSHQIIVDKHEGIKKILHHERVLDLRSLFLLSKVSTKNNEFLD